MFEPWHTQMASHVNARSLFLSWSWFATTFRLLGQIEDGKLCADFHQYVKGYAGFLNEVPVIATTALCVMLTVCVVVGVHWIQE